MIINFNSQSYCTEKKLLISVGTTSIVSQTDLSLYFHLVCEHKTGN